MQNVILSQIPIDDLVQMLAFEVARIVKADRPTGAPSKPEQKFTGDRELAEYLGCTIQTINALKKSGKLPFHRFGRRYYYLRSEVDKAFSKK